MLELTPPLLRKYFIFWVFTASLSFFLFHLVLFYITQLRWDFFSVTHGATNVPTLPMALKRPVIASYVAKTREAIERKQLIVVIIPCFSYLTSIVSSVRDLSNPSVSWPSRTPFAFWMDGLTDRLTTFNHVRVSSRLILRKHTANAGVQ